MVSEVFCNLNDLWLYISCFEEVTDLLTESEKKPNQQAPKMPFKAFLFRLSQNKNTIDYHTSHMQLN